MNEVLIYGISGLFGLTVGSFLNVVIFRLHGGRTLGGRSFCTHCAHKLAWYDLIPVLSFLILRGRCRYCHAKISWQYPLVELSTAIAFMALAHSYSNAMHSPTSLYYFISKVIAYPLLIAIFVYDLRHKIIPDVLVFILAGISLAPILIEGLLFGFSDTVLWHIIAGPIMFTPFFLLWFLSRGTWMGFGDAKLALCIGWMLSIMGGISAILFGFWSGAIFGIVLIVRSHLHARKKDGRVTMKTEVPFAPFLIAGILAVEFFGFSILSIGL